MEDPGWLRHGASSMWAGNAGLIFQSSSPALLHYCMESPCYSSLRSKEPSQPRVRTLPDKKS